MAHRETCECAFCVRKRELQEGKRARLGEGTRPVPGAVAADAVRGLQIRQLADLNRQLQDRIGQLERVLSPAFPVKAKPPPALPPRREADIFASDPMHDQRVVNAQIHGGDVAAALREVASDPSNPRRAQKAALALDYLKAGQVKRGESAELITGVGDAIDAAEAEVRRGWYRRQGVQGLPMGVSEGSPGQPAQRSAVHRGTEPPAGQRQEASQWT